MSRLERKLESIFESKDYYEAHQIYRTLYNRMSNQGKWLELQDMLYNGALRLLVVKEAASAIDLAELYVETLEKSKTPISLAVLDRFEELFNHLPAQLEKDLESSSDQEDRRRKYISLAIKWTMSVSNKKRHRQRGHPALHFRIANSLWRQGSYSLARNHFMHSDDPKTFAHFLIDYHLKYGFGFEKDLFVAQVVLQMLCNRQLKSALELLQAYCVMHPDIKSIFPYPFPLLNFLHFIMISIANKKVTYYATLVEQYESEINRDPEYKQYLDRIGQIYLGLPRPNSSGGGFLGNMIKGFLNMQADGSETVEESDIDSDEIPCIPLTNTDCESSVGTSETSNTVAMTDTVQNDTGITDDMDLD